MSAPASSLDFDTTLYREDALEAAVAAHEGLARFEIDKQPGRWLVQAVDPEPSLAAVLLDSLANHALFETIVRERAVAGPAS